ncbi:imidazole glycerol phosphate synthase subunit hish 2 [Aliivibrio fischeri MJ11]|uniref:Imidazole glycerol phosphate synthase subunit hish 2 n=1 Tax=Aliivibrio fischeri (strain MJ11) TaxID=388396 RepID=B5FFW1_ALIFM|nr:imidazole glycerol phosphate synthase subunit HisH [Aliivibrio fischeri]ACH65102.1 imidazole glycerol phosphate synthase subunit hish 2 [Aliivibrio fischeri MJ11]
MKVDILDVGSGNIRSVKHWIEKANVSTRIVSKISDLHSDLLILPGVGSAGSYMERLKVGKYDQAIIEHVEKGGRLLGICLGFQIMGNYSEEDGNIEGLGLINVHTERLTNNISHNSWEPIYLCQHKMKNQSFNSQYKLTKKRILNGRVFYNHEYGVINNEPTAFSIPVSDGLSQYSGLLVKDNIIGIQFHPEKSQITGSELVSMIL